ncbi:hypothetical protein EVAR_36683_1 [Eumeta japonica]|uniref:Uncharacterized protein n=1 Tax=Eumeta variegata TaxID=151549 RepID=A0A4C1Z6E5_EUMVA|nr:hypothetical protein EVAR_36683_1 [Eumeta japonica]
MDGEWCNLTFDVGFQASAMFLKFAVLATSPNGTSPLLHVPLSMVRPRNALIRLSASSAHAERAAGQALFPIGRYEQPSEALGSPDISDRTPAG